MDIAIFDARGVWCEPSDETLALASAGWTDEHMAAYERLCEAARADAAVEGAEADARKAAGVAFKSWIAARAALAAVPRPTAESVAKASMGRRS